MKAFAPDPLPSTTPPIDPADAELRETFDVLRHLARNKSGPLTPEDLATHVLSVTVGADFPVRRAAMEALLRRVASAAEGEHRILERPDRRAVCGAYRIGRRDGRDQYVTLLTSLSPLAGSCDCRDFGRSALGLCKHLLVLAEVLQAKRAEAWQPNNPHLY